MHNSHNRYIPTSGGWVATLLLQFLPKAGPTCAASSDNRKKAKSAEQFADDMPPPQNFKSSIHMPSSFQRKSLSQHLRVDTEHQIVEMMKHAMEHLRQHNVSIHLDDEVVLLTGDVNSWTDKQTAQESIRSILGNRTIRNDLTIR